MTREEAIKVLEEMSLWKYCEPEAEAAKFAIAALREQEEYEIQRHLKHFDIKEPRHVTDINVGNKWISVEEKLPAVNQRVLVWCESRMRTKHITVSTYMATYFGTRRTFFSRRVRKVTHWMPLPEPPKEEV